MSKLLSLPFLKRLPAAVRRPSYYPAALQPGIVHIGCGAFHKAHQAVYTEQALAAAYGKWGIIGASLRQPVIRDQLRVQDGLYSVLEKGADVTQISLIGCMRGVVFTPDDPTLLPCVISRSAIKLVSLTVTEKGYCHDPVSDTLNFSHPDIVHDVRCPDAPVSAVGALVAGLRARRLLNGQPLTVLCCDNLSHNGQVLQGLVLAFAQATDAETASWIAENVSFPCTMVDRIVPAVTSVTLTQAQHLLGVQDRAAVWSEPYKQWVIEDCFVNERPLWEAGGAEFVPTVGPYEEMKRRLLNGSHSMLAYLGYLAGYQHIDQVMHDCAYATLVKRFMAEEAAPTLSVGHDLQRYQTQLLERFSNPYLLHRCDQIAMDGSQKLPQRLLDTVRANLRAGRSIHLAALAIAGWMRYVSGVDEVGQPIVVQDPLAATLLFAAQGEAAPAVERLLAVRAVFGDDLPQSTVFRAELVKALSHLQRVGSRSTTVAWVARST